MEREREYRWYVTGCERLGHEAVEPEEFAARWSEFEAHAERLKEAEAKGVAPDVAPATRAEMQQRIKDDPFVRAILVGMAEDQPAQ